MEWLINNWTLVVLILCIIGVGFYYLKKFTVLPTDEQLAKVKAFLLCIVIEAEKQFGSKTGKIKLSWVYSQFLKAFPSLATVISFEMFSALVDEVLEEMRHLLETNANVAKIVEGNDV